MSVHKAQPVHGKEFNRVQGTIIDDCAVCAETVKQVPGGHGPTWVHASTGTVVGTNPVGIEPIEPLYLAGHRVAAEAIGEAPMDNDDYDWTDPDFVLGAVLAQVEDLTPADKQRVLQEALAAIEDES